MDTSLDNLELAKARLAIGGQVQCVVTAHRPFGILVDLEHLNVPGVLERIALVKCGVRTPDEYPAVGSHINARIIGSRDYSLQVELIWSAEE